MGLVAAAVGGGRILFRDNALVVPSEDSERLAHAVQRAGVYVALGCNEMDPRPEVQTIYNSLIFFAPDGTVLGRHRKLMPTFTERLFWGQGDARDLVVFDTDIGRLGGLICGEHLMTLVRACMIAQGEDIHVAVFPGAFELHTGPQLEEPEHTGGFWGHFEVRAHALEAGAFVVSGCAVLHEADVADEFPYKGKMNIGYANGGSEVVAPLGIALAGPVYGEALVYAELEAWMIKATKAIVDTMGHYARPTCCGCWCTASRAGSQSGARETFLRSVSRSRTRRSRAPPMPATSIRPRWWNLPKRCAAPPAEATVLSGDSKICGWRGTPMTVAMFRTYLKPQANQGASRGLGRKQQGSGVTGGEERRDLCTMRLL